MRFFCLFSVLFASFIYPCTDFAVQTKDGVWINGRSLEFGLDLQSLIKIFPRNQKIVSQNPAKQKGLEWVSKHGYLGVTALGMDFAFDGINEVGLSFGYLWLPGITEYPTVAPQEMKKALDFTDLGGWILGNFSTVAEVKEKIKSIKIWGHSVPRLGVPPVHAAIHDAQGNHLVIEFIGGEMKIHDNPISVLTNSPAFDWHITNLQNYLNLQATNVDGYAFRGKKIEFPGQGNGMFGLPGDWTPPSRFIKIATCLRFAKQPDNAKDGIILTDHLLNTVDIPIGDAREKGKETGDYTQWVVIKDLKNKELYFRSYQSPILKKIDLKKLNFEIASAPSIPIEGSSPIYLDVTQSLQSKEMVFKESCK